MFFCHAKREKFKWEPKMGARKADDKDIEQLKANLGKDQGPFTIADAATKSGLSFLETKTALNHLVFEFRGQLAATEKGELIYSFPFGFSKPWEKKEKFAAFIEKIKSKAFGVLKFLVRAWISVVMVAYVAVFALILIAMTFARQSDREEESNFSHTLMLHTLLRLIMDSLFWTFHPFSPFRVDYDTNHYYKKTPEKMPFYERVNRFFFGPEEKKRSIEDITKIVLQEIRAKKGRVGIFDVIRVSGLSKDEADPFMAKLLADFDGDVMVSEGGGIFYEFSSIRKSASQEISHGAPAIWQEKIPQPKFTGNSFKDNLLIAGLNGFNLVMSLMAISTSLTLDRLSHMFFGKAPWLKMEPAILLGWIPFLFSLFLFSIPLFRVLGRGKKLREVNAQNGYRGLIKVIFNKVSQGKIKEQILKEGWQEQAGVDPLEKDFNRSIIKLGGDLVVTDQGESFYRFKDLERELIAVSKARQKTLEEEIDVGQVVFNSAN